MNAKPTTCWLAPSSMKSTTSTGYSSSFASVRSSAILSCARSANCSEPGNGRRAMRLVFCGTPQFAIPTLQQLLTAGHAIDLVVTQPDRVRGRDQDPSPPPVKLLAEEAGLPVAQPEKIKNNPDFRARLEAIKPDAIIVVAYGRIVPDWMLNLPRWATSTCTLRFSPNTAAPLPSNGRWPTGRRSQVPPPCASTRDSTPATSCCSVHFQLNLHQTAEQLFPLLSQERCKPHDRDPRRAGGGHDSSHSPGQRNCVPGPDPESAKMPWSTSAGLPTRFITAGVVFNPGPEPTHSFVAEN